MTGDEVREAVDALRAGAVALLPTDTVYGLVAALDSEEGVAALYALKGRPRSQACQVIVYSERCLADALAPLDERSRRAARALLPGPATCIVPDPTGRYGAAAGDQAGTVGVRAPSMPARYGALDLPLVATSANEPGEPPAASIADVPDRIRERCDVVIDAGVLSATASAVVDLRAVGDGGDAVLLRPGPDPEAVSETLGAVGVTLRR